MDNRSEIYSKILLSILPEPSKERMAQLLSDDAVQKTLEDCVSNIQKLDEEIHHIKPMIYFLEHHREEVQVIEKMDELNAVDGESATKASTPASVINLTKAPLVMKKHSQDICSPVFFLPNAKVNEEYSAKIDIRSIADDVNVIIEQILSTDDDFALTYDPETGYMTGLPKIAGSFTLGIRWNIEGYISESTNIEFVVNPDPNSLWKDLPSDEADRYFKPNEAHQYINGITCHMAGASRRGRSHAHIGSFRDDDFWMAKLDNGWNITIVSDGAGSAQNSRKGSAIMVQCIGEFLQTQLLSEEHQNLAESVKLWDDDARGILGQYFKQWFRDSAVLAVKAVEEEADNANETIKSYSSTLLAAVTFKVDDQLFAATFWVGDGAIVAYSPTENVRVLGQVDSGEFAGQTRFLDNAVVRDAAFYDRIRIGKWQNITHFLLMTDGISDPKFETDAALLQTEKWQALIEEINPLLTQDEKSAEALLEWMKFPSPGHHDDRTFIVLW